MLIASSEFIATSVLGIRVIIKLHAPPTPRRDLVRNHFMITRPRKSLLGPQQLLLPRLLNPLGPRVHGSLPLCLFRHILVRLGGCGGK